MSIKFKALAQPLTPPRYCPFPGPRSEDRNLGIGNPFNLNSFSPLSSSSEGSTDYSREYSDFWVLLGEEKSQSFVENEMESMECSILPLLFQNSIQSLLEFCLRK